MVRIKPLSLSLVEERGPLSLSLVEEVLSLSRWLKPLSLSLVEERRSETSRFDRARCRSLSLASYIQPLRSVPAQKLTKLATFVDSQIDGQSRACRATRSGLYRAIRENRPPQDVYSQSSTLCIMLDGCKLAHSNPLDDKEGSFFFFFMTLKPRVEC